MNLEMMINGFECTLTDNRESAVLLYRGYVEEMREWGMDESVLTCFFDIVQDRTRHEKSYEKIIHTLISSRNSLLHIVMIGEKYEGDNAIVSYDRNTLVDLKTAKFWDRVEFEEIMG